MSYFNTTNITGADLDKARDKASKQENAVLKVINLSGNASPGEVYIILNAIKGHGIQMNIGAAVADLRSKDLNAFKRAAKWALQYGEKIPITSVRRAITVLTDKKKLIKTDHTRSGLYGKKEYIWRAL
jgi:hypothetical protein